MVFNSAMDTLHPDAALIEALGGPAAVSRLLGLEGHGTQRVFNWKRRGIPPEVKLDRPDLFLPGWKVPNGRKEATGSLAPLQWPAHQVGCEVLMQDSRAAEVAALKARLLELEMAA